MKQMTESGARMQQRVLELEEAGLDYEARLSSLSKVVTSLSEIVGRQKAEAAGRQIESRAELEMALAANLSQAEADKRKALQRQEQTHTQAFSALELRVRAEQQRVVADAAEAASYIAALQSRLKIPECKEQLRDKYHTRKKK